MRHGLKPALAAYVIALAMLSGGKAWAEQRLDFPFTAQVLDGAYPGVYKSQSSVTKHDMIIMGGVVNITEPIYTNGGRIIIFADVLNIAAPIDTRVRFNHSPDYFEPAACHSGMAQYLVKLPTAQAAFRSYYHHGVTWNNLAKQWVEGEVQPDATGLVMLPELPPGSTPSNCREGKNQFRSDGEPPPDAHVIWDNVKSGDIEIFAHDIVFCETCKGRDYDTSYAKEHDGSDPPGRKFNPAPIPFSDCLPWGYRQATTRVKFGDLLIAKGADGGRPGLGSAWHHCGISPGGPILTKTDSFRCDPKEYLPLGGISSAGGRPAAGGSIDIHVIDNSDRAFEDGKFELGFMVSSGSGGSLTNKIGTPSLNDLISYGDTCAFTWLKLPSDAKLAPSGDETMTDVSPEEALSDVAALLHEMDLGPNYQLLPVLKEAALSRTIWSVVPSDALTGYLAEALASAQDGIVRAAVTEDARTPFASVLPGNLITMRGTAVAGLSKDQALLLDKLRQLLPWDNASRLGAVRSYVRSTGGLMNLSSSDLLGRLGIEQTNIDLADIDAKISVLQTQNINLQVELVDLFSPDIKGGYQERIAKLSQSLQDALTKAEHDASNMTLLTDAAKAVKQVADDCAKDDYGGVISDSGTAIHAISKLFGEHNPDYSVSNDLAAQLAVVKAAYDDFTSYIAAVRLEASNSIDANLHQLIDDRARYNLRIINARKEFPDLLKASLISFARTSNSVVFQSNLQRLHHLETDFPRSPIDFEFQPLLDTCESSAPVELKAAISAGQWLGCIAPDVEPPHYDVLARPDYHAIGGMTLLHVDAPDAAPRSFFNVMRGSDVLIEATDGR
jgi:hypothetical protein